MSIMYILTLGYPECKVSIFEEYRPVSHIAIVCKFVRSPICCQPWRPCPVFKLLRSSRYTIFRFPRQIRQLLSEFFYVTSWAGILLIANKMENLEKIVATLLPNAIMCRILQWHYSTTLKGVHLLNYGTTMLLHAYVNPTTHTITALSLFTNTPNMYD